MKQKTMKASPKYSKDFRERERESCLVMAEKDGSQNEDWNLDFIKFLRTVSASDYQL